jgi:signal transduction histidine kinase
MSDYTHIFEVVTPFLLLILGWLMTTIRNMTKDTQSEVKDIRSTLKELVSKDLCTAHRKDLEHQLDDIRKQCEKCAKCDIG